MPPITPAEIAIAGSALMALASLVLHFTPKFTIAGKAATWIEENGQKLEQAAETVATLAAAAKK